MQFEGIVPINEDICSNLVNFDIPLKMFNYCIV